jgi:hypothetical protein
MSGKLPPARSSEPSLGVRERTIRGGFARDNVRSQSAERRAYEGRLTRFLSAAKTLSNIAGVKTPVFVL